MVLESTLILMDNSEYQRNGDYFPNRLMVQKDGINLVSQTKLRSNPENDIGLMTCATPCQVLCTLMTDQGNFYKKLHDVTPKGNFNLTTSLRVGYLALTHRRSKIHKMRMVAFVGSPMESEDLHDLPNLAKKFKKEKVNVDIICFGENTGNEAALSSFVDMINGKHSNAEISSHILIIPRAVNFLNTLMASRIISESDERPVMTQESYELGFDTEADPELAMALRLSMAEERRRRELAEEMGSGVETVEEPTQLEDMYAHLSYMSEEEQIALAMQMSQAMEEDTEEEHDITED